MPEDTGADVPGADEFVPADITPADITPADIVAGEAAFETASPVSTVSSPGTAGRTPSVPLDTGYTPSGVPTFDSVREKIETRYGTAIGASELAAETPEGRTVEEQYDARQKAAADRLAQIRESMRADEPNNP